MDIHEKVILTRLLSQAQTTAPKSAGTGGRISGDQLARVLTPAPGMTSPKTILGLRAATKPKSGLGFAHVMCLVKAIQRVPRSGTRPLAGKTEVRVPF